MRYLPNFFKASQLEKIFICFPDPHFKAKNHRRRIVNVCMLSEYAYLLKPGGRLYTVTDVEELHKWHVDKCDHHRAFRRLPDEEVLLHDPCVRAILEDTEEGKKVARNKGSKYFAIYERVDDDKQPSPAMLQLFDL
jgi:tRNA (guanine-N7-)-methyltransferase